MSSSTSSISVGRVGRPHGLDGSFHVTMPRERVLEAVEEVVVAGALRRIVRRAGTPAAPILRLEGARRREDAEALRGEELLVPRAAAPPLGEDEWYVEDLEGCRVVDGERAVGAVARVLPLPANEVLEVRRPDAADLLVPLVRDAVRSVDVEAGVIDVDLVFLGEA